LRSLLKRERAAAFLEITSCGSASENAGTANRMPRFDASPTISANCRFALAAARALKQN